MSDSLWPHGWQHARLPCPSQSPRVCSGSCPLNWWCYLSTSSSVAFFSFCHQSFPASRSFPMSQLFTSGDKILVLQLQHQFFQRAFRVDFLSDWLVWSLCNPRDSQESSSTPQFKSINSLALSLLSGSTLISIHDYWKNHSFDYVGKKKSKVMSLLFSTLIGLS